MIFAALFAVLLVQDPGQAIGAATAPQDLAPVTALSGNECQVPELPERSALTPDDANKVGEEARLYADCMKAQIDIRRQQVNELVVNAQAATEELNAQAIQVNAFVQRFNTWQSQPIAASGEQHH